MASAPELPQNCPSRERVAVVFDGRNYPLVLEPEGWRLRSRSRLYPADFRTGSLSIPEAKRRAKQWLDERARRLVPNRKGGGSLESLAKVYDAAAKRTKEKVGKNNISRLRTVCREALGRELEAVTCREVGPELWQAYQRAALTGKGLKFNLTTRYRENIPVNACVRAARAIFLPALLRLYRQAGLDVRQDAGDAVMLPVPYVPPPPVGDDEMVKAWEALHGADMRLWYAVGLARFAGLRRNDGMSARAGWIEDAAGVVFVSVRDRPEEEFWTKTGKPYRAQVIHPILAEHLLALKGEGPADRFIVPDPGEDERFRWFERVPQEWLRAHGITAHKPLHRLRGLYADHIAEITADAVAARLAAIRAAQENLGHASPETTKRHYLTGG